VKSRVRALADSLAARPWFVRWLPAIALAATIWWMSAQSRLDTGLQLGWWGILLANTAHGVVFGTLAVLVHVGLAATGRRRLVCAVILASAYGAIDEFHQSFVPGRSPSVLDWATDTAGALAGAGAAAWVREAAAWGIRCALCAAPLAALSAILESL
jgi:hypothetical protein